MVSARVFVENKNEGRSGKPSGKGRELGKEPRQRSPPEKKKRVDREDRPWCGRLGWDRLRREARSSQAWDGEGEAQETGQSEGEEVHASTDAWKLGRHRAQITGVTGIGQMPSVTEGPLLPSTGALVRKLLR